MSISYLRLHIGDKANLKMLIILVFLGLLVFTVQKSSQNILKYNHFDDTQYNNSTWRYKRHLNIDPALSEISGNGTQSLEAFETVTVQVAAKDSSDNYINSGGETVIIELHNECVLNAALQCVEVAGAKQIFSSPEVATMTDNTDGTYTHSYDVDLDGTVTVFVYITGTSGSIPISTYPNDDLTGSSIDVSLGQLSYTFSTSESSDNSLDTFTALIEVTLIPDYSETYTFYLAYNDGANLTIDGGPIYSDWDDSSGSTTYTHSATAGVGINVQLVVLNVEGGCHFTLEWESPSQTRETIQADSIQQKVLVGGGTIDVGVSCPPGYTGDDPLSPTMCIEKCGNSYKTTNEECDDGNTLDGDGCSSDCQTIEKCFSCTLDGSMSSVCSNSCNENVSDLPWILVLACVCFYTITGILMSITSTSSTSNALSLLNFVQILLLLPLIGQYMPFKVLEFIKGVNICIGSFTFMNLNALSFIKEVINWISVDQNDLYLEIIGLESESSFANIYSTICIVIIVSILHLCLLPCYICMKRKTNPNCCYKLLISLFHWMTMSAYILFFCEIYLLLVLSSLHEINENRWSPKNRKYSIIFAYFVTLIWFCFTIFSICVWLKTKRVPPGHFQDRTNVQYDTKLTCFLAYREILNGFKDRFWARFFSSLFYLRRALIISIVIFGSNLDVSIRIGACSLIQIPYFAYMVFQRPFSHPKDNIVEVLCEMLFTILYLSLLKLNSKVDWTESFTSAYIWTIVANNIICCIIALAYFILSLKNYKCQKNTVKILPKPVLTKETSKIKSQNSSMVPVLRKQSNVKRHVLDKNQHPSIFDQNNNINDHSEIGAYNDQNEISIISFDAYEREVEEIKEESKYWYHIKFSKDKQQSVNRYRDKAMNNIMKYYDERDRDKS